jgi:pimeloyl-ACP methyl ester carboxylesterase
MLRVDKAAKQYLTIDGHRIAYLTAGDPSAPPLVLAHGWLLHAGFWRQTIEAFRDTHYCIAVDLLGLADSDKPANADYSIPAQAKRVLALADALALKKFTLIGHSMGGQIALYIASVLAPERVFRLVDVDGVSTGKLDPYVTRFMLPRLRMAVGKPWLWTLSRRMSRLYPVARVEFQTWFYNFNAIPFADWGPEREAAMQPGMDISAVRCGEAILAADLSNSLARIKCPTLVIFGDHDRVVPISEGHIVHEKVANSHIVVFDNCGHFPMLEQTTRYLDVLRFFLAGRGDASSLESTSTFAPPLSIVGM